MKRLCEDLRIVSLSPGKSSYQAANKEGLTGNGRLLQYQAICFLWNVWPLITISKALEGSLFPAYVKVPALETGYSVGIPFMNPVK